MSRIASPICRNVRWFVASTVQCGADQFRRDLCLHVGKGDHEVRLKLQQLFDFQRGKTAHDLAAGAHRGRGKRAHRHDPVRGAEPARRYRQTRR